MLQMIDGDTPLAKHPSHLTVLDRFFFTRKPAWSFIAQYRTLLHKKKRFNFAPKAWKSQTKFTKRCSAAA